MRAIVVGCGVAGLSSAVRLIEAGWEVEIVARELPLRTTSSVAAAIWYPYKVGPVNRVGRWAVATFQAFRSLAQEEGTGVTLQEGYELFPSPDDAPPDGASWREGLDRCRPADPGELPEPFRHGFALTVPVVEMPIYLPYLEARFRAGGGTLRRRAVDDLEALLDRADLVVHCAGLGARELAGDRAVVPIRGQVVRVERGSIDHFLLDDQNPEGVTYVVPRSKDCVLGGTAEEGSIELEPDEAATRAIRERCARLDARLGEARILEVGVGLRPGRHEVRLEAVPTDSGKLLIHNYGHGGAGVTLSWGCADEVLELCRTSVP